MRIMFRLTLVHSRLGSYYYCCSSVSEQNANGPPLARSTGHRPETPFHDSLVKLKLCISPGKGHRLSKQTFSDCPRVRSRLENCFFYLSKYHVGGEIPVQNVRFVLSWCPLVFLLRANTPVLVGRTAHFVHPRVNRRFENVTRYEYGICPENTFCVTDRRSRCRGGGRARRRAETTLVQ